MDARAALAALPDHSVSVLLTDPPYSSVDRRGAAHGGHLVKWFRGGLSWAEIGHILAGFRPKLTYDGLALVMTNDRGLVPAATALRDAGFRSTRVIVWDRTYPGLGGGLRHQVEYVVAGLLPSSRVLAGVDLVSVPAPGARTGGRDHYPTAKPDDLGRALARIANVRAGDVVLDPFCGTGALLVGARELGAHVIGCDTSPEAIRLASTKLPLTSRPRPAIVSVKRPTGRATR